MRALRRGSPQLPIVLCATGRRVGALDDDHLWAVSRKPIAFQRTIEALDREGSHVYIDGGPLGTLAGYAKHMIGQGSSARVFPVLSIFGRDAQNLSKLLAQHQGTSEG